MCPCRIRVGKQGRQSSPSGAGILVPLFTRRETESPQLRLCSRAEECSLLSACACSQSRSLLSPSPGPVEQHRHPALPLQQLALTPFQVGNEMLLYWHFCWLQNVPFYLFFSFFFPSLSLSLLHSSRKHSNLWYNLGKSQSRGTQTRLCLVNDFLMGRVLARQCTCI